jgi:spore coat protein U-like protein
MTPIGTLPLFNQGTALRYQAIVSPLVLLATMMAGPAHAVTATTTFAVTATVLTSCLVDATSLVFGNYDAAAGTALDVNNTVTATCTTGTSYDIGLDAGTGSGATIASRKMTFGANLLNYSLYQNVGRTTVWGDTIATDTLAATATALPTIHTVYGRVFGSQNVPAGAYNDTINVTLTY